LRDVSGSKAIVVMIALAGASSLFVGNAFQAQMPEFASAYASAQGEITYTLLLTANAAGAVIGGFGLEMSNFFRQPRLRTAVVLGILWSVAILSFALAPTYVFALGALFVAGVVNLAFSSMAQTLVQLEAPPHRRGRVVGLFNMSQQGLRVGSGVTVGVLGAIVGIHASLALSAVALLAVGIALLVYASAPARPLARA
jgi:MFS family permease